MPKLTGSKSVFVLMPFRPEFDDVYMVIRDACNDLPQVPLVQCRRADEIEKPGRITDQIIDAIRGADAIVADVTSSNPNVMYELGYAHALGVPTVIINQSVQDSPFDVIGLRQILYDRNRLVKDCRPRLVSSLSEVLSTLVTESAQTPLPDALNPENSSAPSGRPLPRQVGDSLTMETQTFHLKMELANSVKDREALETLARQLLKVTDSVNIFGGVDPSDLGNFAAVLGNCATELERGELFQQAEDVWKRAIGFNPTHAGVHYQYADFLVDRGRLDEAAGELQRARDLNPTDRRLLTIESKIALASGSFDPAVEHKLRSVWERNKADRRAAAGYLMFLSRSRNTPRFEEVCMEWKDALPESDKADAVRALADHYAVVDDHDRAIDLYTQLLAEAQADDRRAMLHNLATIYFQVDRRDDAERCWREAYATNRNDPIVRAAFSQLLQRVRKLDLAVKVASGESI